MILFKAIQAYKMSEIPGADTLDAALSAAEVREPGAMEVLTEGWDRPDDAQTFVHVVNGQPFIQYSRYDKLLPPAVVKRRVDELVKQKEAQGILVERKERVEIKEQVLLDLLPKAFSKKDSVDAYMATIDDQPTLIVNASSKKKADSFIVLLIKTLASAHIDIEFLPFASEEDAATLLTGFVTNKAAPQPFVLGEDCSMKSGSSAITCKGNYLSREEILAHIKEGYQVMKLQFEYQEHMVFAVDKDNIITAIKFDESVTSELDEDAYTNMVIMTGEINEMLPHFYAMMHVK